MRGLVRLGHEKTHADDRVGLRELGGRLKLLPINFQRRVQIFRREMRREGERQTQLRRQLRAEITRAEQIERHVQSRSRHRAQALPGRRPRGSRIAVRARPAERCRRCCLTSGEARAR